MTATAPGPYTGLDAKLYYNSGTHASPTWVLITRAVDVAAPLSQDESEVNSRSSRWKKRLPNLKDVELNFGYRVPRGADTVFDALLAMLISGNIVEFACMDDIITYTGAQGPRAYMMATAQNLSQALADGGLVEFSLKAAYYETGGSVVDPDWYEAA